MKIRTIDNQKTSVQVASFEGRCGVCECHMMVHAAASGSFDDQLNAIHRAYDEALAQEQGRVRPVFIRYFLSDVSNQAEALKSSLEGRRLCAVSVVGQPPLDGSKVAMWAYLVSDASPVCVGDGLWAADYLGYRHLWLADAYECKGDSCNQTEMLLDAYDRQLNAAGCSIPDNCLRTWFYVQDVDSNYAGVVRGRKDRFMQIGLTEETHYIASTGIAGSNELPDSVVTMDAYAVAGLHQSDVTYIKGSTHLNPTHEYGVTFERGTAVDYDDRRHVLISGTASINNKGEIVYPGDVAMQTRRMWENVSVLLDEAGCTYDDVLHMMVYLRDISDYSMVHDMFEARFPALPKVFVWAPVCRPGWLVEMECMAICHK